MLQSGMQTGAQAVAQVGTTFSEDCFCYIRSLSEKPFDPIGQTDTVDPGVQTSVWEKTGLLFATGKHGGMVRLEIHNGAVPSPIIHELKPGDLRDKDSRDRLKDSVPATPLLSSPA